VGIVSAMIVLFLLLWLEIKEYGRTYAHAGGRRTQPVSGKPDSWSVDAILAIA